MEFFNFDKAAASPTQIDTSVFSNGCHTANPPTSNDQAFPEPDNIPADPLPDPGLAVFFGHTEESVCSLLANLPYRPTLVNAMRLSGTVLLHNRRKKTDILQALSRSLVRRIDFLLQADKHAIQELCLESQSDRASDRIGQVLSSEFGPDVYTAVFTLPPSDTPVTKSQFMRRYMNSVRDDAMRADQDIRSGIDSSWPVPVPRDVIFSSCEDYFHATSVKVPFVCACCSRQRQSVEMIKETCGAGEQSTVLLELLRLTDPYIQQVCDVTEFEYNHPGLNGLMLAKSGLAMEKNGDCSVMLCDGCHSDLAKDKLPKFALKNGLYRGALPEEFKDLTWVEEMVCARWRTSAQVVRLYGSDRINDPFVLKGNTCAHELNTRSTASVLPRTPADLEGMLVIVFIGPGPIKPERLKPLFGIDKGKVRRFLLWLKEHNTLYRDIEVSDENLSLYPPDGIAESILKSIIHHEVDSEAQKKMYEDETSAFTEHPSEGTATVGGTQSSDIFLETMGVCDPDGVLVGGRMCTSMALRRLLPKQGVRPDLLIRRSPLAAPEYDNTDLFPGMFPTLFPYGIGGFEGHIRDVTVAFQTQAEYYLDIEDHVFRRHRFYMFVVVNIMQRRAGHLHSSFLAKRPDFDRIAAELLSFSPELISSVADIIELEGSRMTLSVDQKRVFSLLNKLNTISAKVPGSVASKIYTRNEIRNYMGYFSLPHIYLTMNPTTAHSPIFQVFFGDKEVDLSSRFPKLVTPTERAKRVAEDPVAAADFFDFCINAFFEHLLGWDRRASRSTERGGILGHVRAYYGTCEYTDRGQLHGHFLIWLKGGMNPTEVHSRMKDDPAFTERFLNFFEDVIHHHFPPCGDAVDATYEPRTERPLRMSDADWHTEFPSQINAIGEALQRHRHRRVCEKYGNVGVCRFHFPHDIVEQSFFDDATNSIVLKCLDPTVNYFNPYILMFCRHNHDIRCILSGAAAKAAMFYITDYITKTDSNTGQTLSLISAAVALLPDALPNDDPKERAKKLLHKCLAQFTKQQQIHAQQAVRLIRGYEDGMSSHKTVPMLSGMAFSHVKSVALSNVITEPPAPPTSGSETAVEFAETGDSADNESDEFEPLRCKIDVDGDGDIRKSSQIEDYLHRHANLLDLCFWDFVCTYQKRKISSDTCGPLAKRYRFGTGHQEHKTHYLMKRNVDPLHEKHELVPRVIGMSIPRPNDPITYAIFTLAHFKPFSFERTCIAPGQDIEMVFSQFEFSRNAKSVMLNWEAIHECEDERDAERMKKQAAARREQSALTKEFGVFDDESTALEVRDATDSSSVNFEVSAMLSAARVARWIHDEGSEEGNHPEASSVTSLESWPIFSDTLRKHWKKEIKTQSDTRAAQRRAAADPSKQVVALPTTTETLIASTVSLAPIVVASAVGPLPTTQYNPQLVCDSDKVIAEIEKSSLLNPRQQMAFRIIAQQFMRMVAALAAKPPGAPRKVTPADAEPLRMLLTGPGGTGKTHVVNGIQKLMIKFGCGHRIRYLAPTGTAAALIDGTTIHAGLGITIEKKNKGKGNRLPGSDSQDWSVVIDKSKSAQMRADWKDVWLVLSDESSMQGQELLNDFDQALRYVMELPNEWFGGVSVIFAGDFFQYPPVGAAPLYKPIPFPSSQTKNDSAIALNRRIGRLAWKTVDTVIELEEQMRMEADPGFAAAVLNLRKRTVNAQDLQIFNSRVIRSEYVPWGLTLSEEESKSVVAIVPTNIVRQALNVAKARSNCVGTSRVLITCAARDTCNDILLPQPHRDNILRMNCASNKNFDRALPGFIPAYVGMPVILRSRNISTELRITNGSRGKILNITSYKDETGYDIASCVYVLFDNCLAALKNLPPGVVPITPISWTFHTKLAGSAENFAITRHQLPLEPAFAITGHAAQGQTLRGGVLVDLGVGGPAAYVAASRATSRETLFLVRKVSLTELNLALPGDLLRESHRLDALFHNTMVKHGFLHEALRPVPDPESERATPQSPARSPEGSIIYAQNPSRKRPVPADGAKGGPPKKPRLGPASITTQERPLLAQPLGTNPISAQQEMTSALAFCIKWDAVDWSCSYDAVLASLYFMLVNSSPEWRLSFSSQTELAKHLFDILLPLISRIAELSNVTTLDDTRDLIRDRLTAVAPTVFFRHGACLGAASEFLRRIARIDSDLGVAMHRTSLCTSCGHDRVIGVSPFHFCLASAIWSQKAGRLGWNAGASSASLSTWLRLVNSFIAPPCPNQCDGPQVNQYGLEDPPPWIYVEVMASCVPCPLFVSELEFQSSTGDSLRYGISSIIYPPG